MPLAPPPENESVSGNREQPAVVNRISSSAPPPPPRAGQGQADITAQATRQQSVDIVV
ncbi:MAG: hypothetical protein HQL52_15850, partial [Magnetococcales bacterium]|nr:hypothetical protein [Magnetococcales bacterium]